MGLFGDSGGIGGGDDINITVSASTEKAEKSIQGLDKTIDKARETTEKLDTKTVALGAAFGILGEKIGSALIKAPANLLAMSVGLASAGENLGSLRAGFGALGGDISSIDEASQRVLGLASKTQLLETANKAMVAGLPDVNKKFGDIADLGARLANTLGKDVNTSIQGLTDAIARGRPMQLAQYGLFVDSKDAAEKYAQANGLLADKLTETQKRAAIQEEALRQVKDRLGDIAEVSPSVTNQISAIKNRFQDMRGEIGEVINSNDDLIDAFGRIKKELDLIDTDIWGIMLADVLTLASGIVGDLSGALNGFAQGVSKTIFVTRDFISEWAAANRAIEAVFKDSLTAYFNTATLGIFKTKTAIDGATQSLTFFGRVQEAIKNELSSFFSALKFGWESTLEAITGNVKKLGETDEDFKKLGESLDNLANTNFPSAERSSQRFAERIEKMRKELAHAREQSLSASKVIRDDLDPSMKKLSEGTKKSKDKIVEHIDVVKMFRDTFTRMDLDSKVKELNDAYQEGVLSLGDYQDHLIMLQKEMKEVGISAEQLNAALGKVNLELDKPKGKTGKGGWFAGLFGDIFDAEEMKKVGGALEQAMGQMINQVMNTMGSLLLDVFGLEGGGIGNQLGTAIGSGLGAAVGAAFGSPEIGAMVGNIAGGLLGSFADKIFGGSTNEQTRRRRQVEEAIDDIFKTWDFLARDYEGRMVRFEDLVLGSRHDFNAGSVFMQELETFDDDLRLFFRTIGGALGVQFADDFVAGAQIGEKLLTAWGGDLDSLQLLLYESEMTFEQFSDNLVRAFKRGQISAEEFITMMAKGEEMFQPGLVGLGQWERAIDNFVESGGRGTASMKALKDMFIEWRELNPQGTLEQFREEMIASGAMSIEDANALFDAMKANGITTIEDLLSASEDLIITIIGTASSLGFAFTEPLEAVQERLEGIERSLDVLGQGRMIPVRLRISSEYDSNQTRDTWQQLTRSGGIGQNFNDIG